MQETKTTPTQTDRGAIKTKTLEALVTFVSTHHDWAIPSADHRFWLNEFPGSKLCNIRNMVLKLAEEGSVIKVLAREMPECLRLRPPSWMALGLASFSGPGHGMIHGHINDKGPPVAHFLPSPTYLKSLATPPGGHTQDTQWLLGESHRIWRELQGESVRAYVRTNVPSLTAAAVDSLTATLAESLLKRPDVRRDLLHGAVVLALKNLGCSFPLRESDRAEVLKVAGKYLQQRFRVEVRDVFRPLNAVGWVFPKGS